jgi:hypothetical protein
LKGVGKAIIILVVHRRQTTTTAAAAAEVCVVGINGESCCFLIHPYASHHLDDGPLS